MARNMPQKELGVTERFLVSLIGFSWNYCQGKKRRGLMGMYLSHKLTRLYLAELCA